MDTPNQQNGSEIPETPETPNRKGIHDQVLEILARVPLPDGPITYTQENDLSRQPYRGEGVYSQTDRFEIDPATLKDIELLLRSNAGAPLIGFDAQHQGSIYGIVLGLGTVQAEKVASLQNDQSKATHTEIVVYLANNYVAVFKSLSDIGKQDISILLSSAFEFMTENGNNFNKLMYNFLVLYRGKLDRLLDTSDNDDAKLTLLSECVRTSAQAGIERHRSAIKGRNKMGQLLKPQIEQRAEKSKTRPKRRRRRSE